MPSLDGPCRRPRGATDSIVVLLHGYGADGHDLIGLADAWRDALPGTLFLAPDAPEMLSEYFGGRQWFPLVRRDAEELLSGVETAGPIVDRYLDEVLAEATSLPARRLALVGFSQGAMMALHVGLRRRDPIATIVAYSGCLVGPRHLAAEIASRPPVLLVHGADDDIIPVAALTEARESLIRADVPVSAYRISDVGHGIDPEGLRLGCDALLQAFAT